MKQFLILTFFILPFYGLTQNKLTPYYHKAKNNINDTVKVNALNHLAKYHSNVNLDSCKFYAERAYSLADFLKYRNGKAAANLNRGILQNNLGNFPEALEFLQAASVEAEEIGDYRILCGTKLNLGNLYILTGDYTLANQFYQDGIVIAEQHNLYSSLASLYISAAMVLKKENQKDSAMVYYTRVLEMEETILHDSIVIAAIYNNMASVYFDKKDLKSAEEYLLKSYYINEKMGNLRYQLMNLGNLGALMGMPEGNLNKAVEYYEKAIELAKKNGTKDALVDFYGSLSKIYYNHEKPKEAYDYLSKSIAYKDSVMNDEKQEKIVALTQEYNTRKIQDSLRLNQQELRISQSSAEAANLKAAKTTYQLLGAVGMILLVLVILFFVYRNSKNQKRINSLLQEKNEEINLQKITIEEKKNELTDSINYAKRIQSALLPSVGYMKDVLGDYFLLFRPKDIVSGDFYWVKQQENKHLFAVADCTGHGVPGAMVSMLGYETIEKISAENHDDAAKFLSAINRALVNALSTKSTTEEGKNDQVKDGMDLSLCIVTDKNKLSFCGANNSCFVLRNTKNNLPAASQNISIQHGETFNLIELKATKRPIGFHHSENDFIAVNIDIYKDDIFYLFSDGYADQFGGDKGKKMKTSTFREQILAHAHLPVQEQYKALTNYLDLWQRNFDQLDDITVLCVRVE